MFKKILLLILILLLIGLVVFAVMIGTGGKLFQGALYNIRPIYQSCSIEGQNYQSDLKEDCENFTDKFDAGTFPDGEYTIFAQYTDKQLPESVIPIKISENGKVLACTYLQNGYEPQVSVFTVNDMLSTQLLSSEQELPVNSMGTVAQFNYKKNGKVHIYDTNICERAFQANILDEDKQPLGPALLDHNGFINSRPLVNEVLITTSPYYSNAAGQVDKTFRAGNIFATLSAAPDITFKFTIPCSAEKATAYIPTLETNKDIRIPFEGLDPHYLKTCGSRLYISLQNTNRADDIQIFDNLELAESTSKVSYLMKLSQIARVVDKDTTFPISFKVSLHLRDRSDSKEVLTLGSGLLTIKSYKPGQSNQESEASDAPIKISPSTKDNGLIINNSSTIDATVELPRPKVKRDPAL